MIAVIQRVERARVSVAGISVGEIGHGLLILLGVAKGDTLSDADYLCDKIAHMRIFDNDEGRFDFSLLDIEGQAMVVSQFTLLGSWRKGRRPGYDRAAPPDEAEPLVSAFAKKMRDHGVAVETGAFGAHMHVETLNDGPVTFTLDTAAGQNRTDTSNN